jgi:ATP-dependent RNA helicase RhlE
LSFDRFEFDPWIADGVKAAGYEEPTPIQAEAIPPILEGRDVLGLAQTGTGKTAAFMLPILEQLLEGELGEVRALIVAPTRELAEQINEAFKAFAKATDLRSTTVYGGVSKNPQIDALRRGVEVVVACPGRLLDHYGAGDIDLSTVEILVLDEADHMCDMGFLPDIRRILKAVPEDRQTLFFSATMPSEIRHLADSMLTDPVTVQIGETAPVETVSHALYPTTERLKKDILIEMIKRTESGRMLVFTRTKHRARSLATILEKRGHNVTALQGNMAQNKRQQAINGFKKGKYDILVATDIAARGIDISDVSHVINYDMPSTVDAYTHRIGRTGRALRHGWAYTLATQADEQLVSRIERVLDEPIERRTLEDFDYGGYDAEGQGPRLSEKKPQHSRSDGRGGMNAPEKRRSFGGRPRRISRR